MSTEALAAWLAAEVGAVAVGAGLTRLKEAFTGRPLEGPMWIAVEGAADEAAVLVEVYDGIDRVALRESLVSRLQAPLDRVPSPTNDSFTEIVRAGSPPRSSRRSVSRPGRSPGLSCSGWIQATWWPV